MKTPGFGFLALAFACFTVLLSPGVARADGGPSLTGSADISWLYPNTSNVFSSSTVVVGSSITCPGASSICNAYSGMGTEVFSVGPSTLSLDVSGFPPSNYSVSAFNGFDFSNLSFAGGGCLSGFSLATNITGLTSSDVSFTCSSIEVNLAGLPVGGDFTLDLTSTSMLTPEPSSLVFTGTGFLALGGLIRRRVRL